MPVAVLIHKATTRYAKTLKSLSERHRHASDQSPHRLTDQARTTHSTNSSYAPVSAPAARSTQLETSISTEYFTTPHPPSPCDPQLTKLSNLQTGSLGCAPTPSQYFVRLVSSCMFLYFFCGLGRPVMSSIVSGVSVASGTRGMGS